MEIELADNVHEVSHGGLTTVNSDGSRESMGSNNVTTQSFTLVRSPCQGKINNIKP
jgi:hypothetical protein